jgi:serine/threonine protein kinase/tetratricopeptide (TPR) repeat protein
MDPQRWQRVQELFHRAADLPEPDRASLLATVDEETRSAVLGMLDQDAKRASVIDRDLTGIAADLFAGAPLGDFGQYRIQKILGEGGMGVVYLAERADLGNLVAIKILRDAWLSPSRRKRFETEQRTLAHLIHPSIARLYDAATLPNGTPWFAMEYVDGIPLTEYCRRHSCSIEDRLKLVRLVCEAAQYAHDQGVIHRDLKPSNILVKNDGSIRLLDFGIAKQLDPEGNPVDQTRTALRPMTPAYAAPEQLRGEQVGVQTDVYSLGVVLYELLAGRLPFDLSNKTPTEAAMMIVTAEPAASGAGNDLDTLCLTAMDKDPERRYASVAALTRDIDHYLNHEPLDAHRDSPGYKIGKFVRRNRLILASAAALLLLIVASALAFSNRTGPLTPNKTVAVLPFVNTTGDSGLDYLSIALPNEIATLLSYTRSVSVRPVEAARKFAGRDVDLQAAGRELRAGYVVTGRYSRNGDRIQLSMEMAEVENNRLQWRDTFDVPAENRLAMQAVVVAKTFRGLNPILGHVSGLGGVAQAMIDSGTQPKNEEAYDLFLRATALQDVANTYEKVRPMLERSLALDPGYAPAWSALAGACIGRSWYSNGGPEDWDCALRAGQRAADLDPNNVVFVVAMAMLDVERHDFAKAYREVKEGLRRRPDHPHAHIAASYVLRYAGLLTEAERECDTVLLLDSQDGGVRSCAVAFMLHGDYQRTRDFLNMDLGSDWERALSIDLWLREGREREALAARPAATPQWAGYDMLLAYLEHRPASEVARLARTIKANHDPEVNYFSAAHLSYAGQTDAALQMLKQTVDGGYCSYPAIDSDPMFASLRSRPEFQSIRSAAIECQSAFLAHRDDR